MSTVKINVKQNRFALLARLNEEIFHIDDLQNLWNIREKNTLHTTLKRYVDQELLYRIYRGFYSLKPLDKIDPYLLGIKALHGYGYVSTETILAKEGIISQNLDKITLISSQSRRFSLAGRNYYSRKLDDKFLFNPAGLLEKAGVKSAALERAVADLLYFNPRFHFDGKIMIDWKKVKNLQKEIGYPPTSKRY
ncbi:MAG: hypothetical protein WCW77_04385 [Patescibacteria group bacterium]|jgi:predicted transcriptional regulator of viral defense system